MPSIKQAEAKPLDPEALWSLLASPERHFEALVALSSQATAAGRFDEALRFADRARRLAPESGVVAGLCGRLLLRLGRPDLALRAVSRASLHGAPQLVGVVRSEALLALGDARAASGELDALLEAFALDAIVGLPRVAEAICSDPSAARVGWVGLASSGEVIGALSRDAHAALIEQLRPSAQARVAEASERAGALMDVRAVLTPQHRRSLFRDLSHQVIGARSLCLSPSWRLDARVARRGDVVRGAATLGWASDASLTVIVTEADGEQRRVRTAPKSTFNGLVRQEFSVPLDGASTSGALVVEVLSPDQERLSIDIGPVRVSAPEAREFPQTPPPAKVAVVVPVYAGLEETLACLNSVLATTDPGVVDLIVVDDASPEPELKRALASLAAAGRMELLTNLENRGYPHSVNRGMASRPQSDVVLLNADAEVFGDWLERLRRAAYDAPDIATVTPFSNNGSMMAYPSGDDTDVDGERGAALDALFARVHARGAVDLPSGAGFCLYIRRDSLRETGMFEEQAFGRGYGEENDFCLRAAARGWRHVGATDVFVRHAGGRSFGPLKPLLIEHNLKTLYRRHPRYRRAIKRFLTDDPLRAQRRAVDEAWLTANPAPSVLLISLARGGGVSHHTAARARKLGEEGLRAIELLPAKQEHAAGVCRLSVVGEALNDLEFHLPHAFEPLVALLATLQITRVEIHHTLGLHPLVLAIPRRLGLAYDVFIHDYNWICPRITLIAGDRQYCGEPDLASCERCIQTHGSQLEERISVADLRARSAAVMAKAARVIVPTLDVAKRLRRYFPDIEPIVAPWEPTAETLPSFDGRADSYIVLADGRHSAGAPYPGGVHPRAGQRPDPGAGTSPTGGREVLSTRRQRTLSPRRRGGSTPEGRAGGSSGVRRSPLRVAIVGAIGEHKGFHRVLEACRDARDRDLPLEFVVIGHTEDDLALFETGRAFVTGRYEEDETVWLIEREQCDVALLPSVWPETWCYALTHLLRSGLPIVAFDLGGLAERLRGVERARLLPLDTDASSLNATLLSLARSGAANASTPAPQARIGVRFAGDGSAEIAGGAWARSSGGDAWIEGFCVALVGVAPGAQPRYRASVIGADTSPWVEWPSWAQSASASRPLAGFAVSLPSLLSTEWSCRYSASFSSGSVATAEDGADCRSPLSNDPVTAIRISLTRRP